MNLIPFFETTTVIQYHTISALFALVLGAIILRMRKGTGRHKLLGRVWATAMVIVAASSFWINEIKIIGQFSPLHVLSILVLVSVVWAILAARRGDIIRHRRTIKWLYFEGLSYPAYSRFFQGV
ncbi:MAG: DUF2306 domain-containing protein [Ahrensia sp.]|nr:DUF2306 domain-containing protein [Ahrensia sp.]